MIVIHTNAPLIPLTQMVAGDGVIGFSFEDKDVLTVSVADPVTGYWVAKTLDILGYQVAVEDTAGVAVGD